MINTCFYIPVCLAHPPFWACSVKKREANVGLNRSQMIKMALKTRRCCAVPSFGKKYLCFAFPLLPTLGNSFLMKIQSMSATIRPPLLSFLQRIRLQTRHNSIFKKIETKRRCCVKYIESDSNFTTHKCNCFYYVVTFVWSVITDCLNYIELCIFDLNPSSIHLWGIYAVQHTQVLANHSSGRLLQSPQSATPIQTERSDEGLKTGQKISYSKLCFLM